MISAALDTSTAPVTCIGTFLPLPSKSRSALSCTAARTQPVRGDAQADWANDDKEALFNAKGGLL